MRTLLSVSAKEEQEVTITLKGNPDIMRRALLLLASLDWASSVGHAGTYAVPIDGDGGETFSVTFPDDINGEIKEECAARCNAMSSYGGDIEEIGSTASFCHSSTKSKRVWPKDE